ncbi:hypothetical protein [Komagataeibacter diospyri]|uniref:hypothetical protein n=1 Tax=Komagataeibacter diospyri TaxID=1932662 RepID=UPI001143EFBB|nr:hypothetical protein [Komagataeibacter diospyri]
MGGTPSGDLQSQKFFRHFDILQNITGRTGTVSAIIPNSKPLPVEQDRFRASVKEPALHKGDLK